MPKKDPCKIFACRIQECLNANDYQISRCEEALNNMHACCRKWKELSFVCEGMKSNEHEQQQPTAETEKRRHS